MPNQIKREEMWEVEDAMHTLERAEEIKKDDKMMSKVGRMAKKRREALSKIINSTMGSKMKGNKNA